MSVLPRRIKFTKLAGYCYINPALTKNEIGSRTWNRTKLEMLMKHLSSPELYPAINWCYWTDSNGQRIFALEANGCASFPNPQ